VKGALKGKVKRWEKFSRNWGEGQPGEEEQGKDNLGPDESFENEREHDRRRRREEGPNIRRQLRKTGDRRGSTALNEGITTLRKLNRQGEGLRILSPSFRKRIVLKIQRFGIGPSRSTI